MLAFFGGPRSADPDLFDRVARSLGLFAALDAPGWKSGAALAWQLPRVDRLPPKPMRRRMPGSWRRLEPATTRSGAITLFHGALDNAAELANQLGIGAADDAAIYAAAFDRWGDRADERLIGHYCAIVHVPGSRSARLSRSALRAPPLHYFHNADSIGVGSVPRVLEVMGLERRLNMRKLADALYFNPTEDEDFLQGAWRVGLGEIVHVEPGKRRKLRFYDPLAIAHSTNRGNPQDLVREADRLLTEAARLAIVGSRQPGIALSGGLDSSNVAARVLRALPAPRVLKSFTNVPIAASRQAPVEGYDLDEQARVEAFAACHPRLEAHFVRNEGLDFDYRLNDLFLAMGTGQSCVPVNFRFMGLFDAAQKAGCDLVLTSDLGETTFSSWGDWGYAEYFRTGRWRQLYRALLADSRGNRPLLRRFVARAIMPLLPAPAWKAVRRLRGRRTAPINVAFSVLSPDALDRFDTIARARSAGMSFERDEYAFRRQMMVDQLSRGDIEASDYLQAVEQLYEVRVRDVPAYRPLFEFCTGLPTNMFLRDGTLRWLAREMGRGLMPDAQRTSTTIGIQDADWHAVMTPRVPELLEQVRGARHNPQLEGLLDLDRLEQLLVSWPETSTLDHDEHFPRAFALPRAIAMIQYVDYMTGRNPH